MPWSVGWWFSDSFRATDSVLEIDSYPEAQNMTQIKMELLHLRGEAPGPLSPPSYPWRPWTVCCLALRPPAWTPKHIHECAFYVFLSSKN